MNVEEILIRRPLLGTDAEDVFECICQIKKSHAEMPHL